jgi:hypothetical protein
MGFVIEAMRKMESRRIGAPPNESAPQCLDVLVVANAHRRDEPRQITALDVCA